MASLIRHDKQGVIGPINTLLTVYQHLNVDALTQLVDIIEINRLKLATGPWPIVGKRELVDLLLTKPTVGAILASEFFQSLLSRKKMDDDIHTIIMDAIIPNIVKVYELDHLDKQAITEWLAKLLQSYLTDEQILQIEKNNKDPNNEKIMEFRKEIGTAMYSDCSSGKIPKEDIVWMLQLFDMDKYNNDKKLLQSIATYVCDYQKHYSNMELMKLGEIDIENIIGKPICRHLGNYLMMFSMAENPANLMDEVKSLITTAFIPKIYT